MYKTGHFTRSEPHQPFPQDLITLLAAFPDTEAQATYRDEEGPQKKRLRIDNESEDAITISKANFMLERRCRVGHLTPQLQRLGIERFLKLQVDDTAEGNGEVKKLIFSTLPRSEYGKYRIVVGLGKIAPISADLISIFDVLNRSRDTVESDGALSVSTDLTLDTVDGQTRMILDFKLKWNQSNSVLNGLRNSTQRKISTEVQKQFLATPGDYTNNDASALSPQVFYESAFMTDESFSDLDSAVIPNLTSRLYPFQRRALQWLLAREGVKLCTTTDGESHRIEDAPALCNTGLPLSFRERKDAAGSSFYHSDLYHVVSRDIEPWRELESSLRGGILAEEMGLGKTVETISLILLHRRSTQSQIIHDPYTNQLVRATGATLIVTPETLKKQWVGEISKHAPILDVMVYEGRAKHRATEEELIQQMMGSDIVVTTYNVLRTEVHFARPEPERSRRHERTHSRASSPLIKLSWWRVCLDEAQQIESGVSAAAEVARLVPRVNAWGITGTPVKEKTKDLWGLLLFLRYEPFASYPAIWDALVTSHQPIFKDLFKRLALRHTKHAVRHELVLPQQKRFVITMPFTAVEEQNYRTRFKHEVETLGLDTTGTPLNPAEWDSSTPSTIDQMRRALATLRQTVLHPQLGPERARVLGQVNRALKTIDEVLDAMIDQTDTIIKTHQRAYFTAKLKRGQLLENSPRVREALAIWEEALREIETVESECRDQLRIEIETVASDAAQGQHAVSDDIEGDTDEENVSPRVGAARRKLRSALDLKHRAVFFIASAYYQIKTNEDWTQPDSDEFKRLEKLEVDGYDRANQIRKEILQEVHGKASGYMAVLAKKVRVQSFVEIPQLRCHLKAGIETRRYFDDYGQLIDVLNDQANMVDEWREIVIQLLIKPLVDQEEDEITGEEYENSTKIQDDLMVYTTILRAAISDRQDSLSGLVNERIKHEMKMYRQQAKQGEGASPAKFLELLQERDQVKPNELHGSLRAVTSDLRELAIKLQGDNTDRSSVELRIVRDFQKLIHEETLTQTKINSDLEKELNLFTSAMNARVECKFCSLSV